MFRIDDATAASSLPAPEAAGTEGYFTEGNPTAGTPATNVRGSWMNMIQEELRAVVVAGGLTPSKTTYTQVRDAVLALFAKINGDATKAFSVAAATAAAQAVNLGQLPAVLLANGYVTIPVLVAGVKRNLIIQWGNTGASSSGGPVTIPLPITFPTQTFAVCLGGTTVGSSVFPTIDNTGLTTSSFPYSTWNSTTGARAGGLGSTYIAVGY
jgi:hypothetical protein